jgi:hypothetical protein
MRPLFLLLNDGFTLLHAETNGKQLKKLPEAEVAASRQKR